MWQTKSEKEIIRKNIWKKLSKEIKHKNKKFINFKKVRVSVITHWLKQYNLRQK